MSDLHKQYNAISQQMDKTTDDDKWVELFAELLKIFAKIWKVER